MSPENAHKLIRIYMGGLILGVNTLYMLSCFLKQFALVGKGLRSSAVRSASASCIASAFRNLPSRMFSRRLTSLLRAGNIGKLNWKTALNLHIESRANSRKSRTSLVKGLLRCCSIASPWKTGHSQTHDRNRHEGHTTAEELAA